MASGYAAAPGSTLISARTEFSMSFRRKLLTLALASSSLLAACVVQRPFYRDVVQPAGSSVTAGSLVDLIVLDSDTNQPVKGAKVLWGEDSRSRESYVTDEDGRVSFDVTPALLKENPLVEVVLPRGVRSYRLQVVPATDAAAPEASEASAAPATPEAPAVPETPAAEDSAAAPETGN
ncbi:hypothetical protein HNV28_05750 [Myxococcus xanthus]|uniref:Lipoprotein n=2 Tax=Myxococcus xanthus TaxID=34 RepID=A0A7Y4MQV4_MYXXA|nr:hypothetical protein [Myxococcus xanthus]NOJ84101.1 hypothetical protein [Myxococcus xanthus]